MSGRVTRRSSEPRQRQVWRIAVLAALIVFPTHARADVSPPAREVCPRGALGTSVGHATYCLVSTCISDASCREDFHDSRRTRICRPAGLCVGAERFDPRARRPAWGEDQELVAPSAIEECAADADCAFPARCEVTPRCVSPTLPELVGDRAGCACGVAGRGRSSLIVGWLLAVVGVLLGRRRQQRPAARRGTTGLR